MSHAALVIDAVFGEFGLAASYVPPGGGAAVACAVILAAQDRELAKLGGRHIAQGQVMEVRRSELASPARAGVISLGTDSYAIVSDPEMLDPERLVWTFTVRG